MVKSTVRSSLGLNLGLLEKKRGSLKVWFWFFYAIYIDNNINMEEHQLYPQTSLNLYIRYVQLVQLYLWFFI